MIILDTAIGEIITIDNVQYQNVVVSIVVDKEADLPAQNALGNNQIMVAPSICHCTKESTDWQMDSTGAWFKQKSTQDVNATVQLDLTNYYTKTETDQAIEDAVEDIDLTDYYTKTETDQEIYTSITNSLTNYYNKTSIDSMLSDYVTTTDLTTNYYTKTESDNKFVTPTYLSNNYYTKSESNSRFVFRGPDEPSYQELLFIISLFYPSMSSGIAIPANFDLDSIEGFIGLKQAYGYSDFATWYGYGKFYCTAVNAQTSQHKPVTQPGGYGVWMEAFGTADNNRFVQTLIYNVTGSASNRNKIYKRFYSSGGWSNWFTVDMTEIIP